MSIGIKPAKHSAPGQYLGFTLQSVRFCYHLLTCPRGAKVSLEYLDDVAIHNADGTFVLEQTKSALKQNPLADWANDFWKALANWIQLLDSGSLIPARTRFEIYVTPPRAGKFAQALSDATTPSEITAFIGTISQRAANARRPPACMRYLQLFLDAPPDMQTAIVQHFKVKSTDADPVDAIRMLLAPTIMGQHIDLFCASAIGMAKQQAEALIRGGHDAIIAGDIFKAWFLTFVQKNLMPGLLTSFTNHPDDKEVVSILLRRPTFVRQLELIAVTDDERLRAVADFLRTSADKSDWAERGLIFEESLREWDEDLIRRHKFITADIADRDSHRASDVRGRMAYRQCALLQAPLEGRAVPGHFVHGCFNALADTRRIGWHPNFETLLGEDAS